VIVRGNDALLPRPIGRTARLFSLLLGRLRETGWQPVVVPCPVPGHAPGFRAPARLVGGHRSRRLARRQARSAVRAVTPLSPSSGPEFQDRAELLRAPDGVHPSSRG
ncbi:hypothetical protein PUR56_02815, partial [Streptomyces sp. BE303]|nr:hypothetical protein [Streptomyces sp. BE303]